MTIATPATIGITIIIMTTKLSSGGGRLLTTSTFSDTKLDFWEKLNEAKAIMEDRLELA